MNHTCLCLRSRSWYSFTDPRGIEGWVGLGLLRCKWANSHDEPGSEMLLVAIWTVWSQCHIVSKTVDCSTPVSKPMNRQQQSYYCQGSYVYVKWNDASIVREGIIIIIIFLRPSSTKPQVEILKLNNVNGCNDNSFGNHSILEGYRIPPLKSHGQALEEELCFPGVLSDNRDAPANLLRYY